MSGREGAWKAPHAISAGFLLLPVGPQLSRAAWLQQAGDQGKGRVGTSPAPLQPSRLCMEVPAQGSG